MSIRSSSWLYLVVIVVAVSVGGLLFFTSLSPNSNQPTGVPETWEGILSQADNEGRIRIFVDGDLEVRSFLETSVIPQFQEEHDIIVEIETGHWSGFTQRLLTERLGGRNNGLLDLAIIGDEAMGRSLDTTLFFTETGNLVVKTSNIETIFQQGVSGIRNDGGSVTIWIDQYVLVGNVELLEDLPLDLGEIIGIVAGEDEGEEDADPGGEEEESEIQLDQNQLFFPNPLEVDAGVAALMLTVIDHGGLDSYSFRPYDSELEEVWPEALGFDVEEEPELEGLPAPEEEPPEDGLRAIIDGEIALGYIRYDEIITFLAGGGIIPDEIRVYLPIQGSIISGGHAGIPFNAPNKSAALVFLDFLLSDEVQVELIAELGKYPSVTIDEASLPVQIIDSTFWIPKSEVRASWVPWPHFQYRVDLLDLWRSLTGE